MSYSPEEFALEVIRAISEGHYGVKVRDDGSVLLDVCGFMQADKSIGEKRDPNFSPDNCKEYLIKNDL